MFECVLSTKIKGDQKMEMEEKYFEKPWLKSQKMAFLPENLEPYPEIPYTEFILDKNVEKYPNELALVCLDYEMTFKELKEHVDRFATALSDLGVKKGDVVATILQTSIQFVIADLAIPEIGAIHAPMSMLDSVEGLVDKWTRTNTKTVVCVHTNMKDGDILGMVKEAANQTNVKNIIVTKTEDYSKNPPMHGEEGVIWFTDLIEKYPPNPPKVDIDPKKDTAILFFTGGTTGLPKGVMLSHYNLSSRTVISLGSNFPQSLLHLLVDGFFTEILLTPMFHIYCHEFYEFFMSWGYTLLLVTDPRDTKEFIRVSRKYHPVFTPTAPTQYMKLAEDKEMENLGLLALSGSMALAKKTQESFEEKSKSIVFESYGFSETSGAATMTPSLDVLAPMLGGSVVSKKLFSPLNRVLEMPGIVPLLRMALTLVGRRNVGMLTNKVMSLGASLSLAPPSDKSREFVGSVGFPFVGGEIKILDEETGGEIPISKVVKEKLRGELCIKGPHVMLGYWPDVGTGFDEEGYIHSGDIVTIDKKGGIHIVDRTKDMVNISGYKVYTIEMDDMLYEVPGVSEAAVVGIPDPDRPGSERLKVFIAPTPEYRGKIKEEDVINFFRGKVAKYAVPKSVEFMDELPRTPAEKIFKRGLRDTEIEKMKKKGILK